MKLDQVYESENLPEVADWAPIPEGWYKVTITGATLKATKNGNGQYIAIQYSIIGPTYEGRIIFANLNIRNTNPKAQEIGLQQLNSVMRAIGLLKLQDTDELFGKNIEIKVKIQPEHDGYPASNNVTGWRAIESGVMPKVEKKAESNIPSFLKH